MKTMNWYNSMTRPNHIPEDRTGQFGDCITITLNFDQEPEYIRMLEPEEVPIYVPVCTITPEGDVVLFWTEDLEPVDRRGDF